MAGVADGHPHRHEQPGLLRRVIDGLTGALGLVAAAVVVILMLGIVFDVLTSGLGGDGIRGLAEYGEIAVVIIVFLAIAQAQRTQSHVAVDILVERFPPRVAGTIRAAVLTAMCLLLLWMAYQTWQSALVSFESREQRFGLVRVPIWPARFAIPLGFFAMALQCALQALDEIRALGRQGSVTATGESAR